MLTIRRAALFGVAIALPLLFLLSGCAQQPLTLEQRAQALDRRIMCPVCPGETIDQTQAEIGKQMRALVREKLAEGWSDDQILEFFADRYGPSILAQPPRGGFPLLAWIAPPVGLVLALGVLALVLRAMRRSAAAPQPQAQARREELAPYLNAVDRELQEGTRAPSDRTPKAPERGQGRQR